MAKIKSKRLIILLDVVCLLLLGLFGYLAWELRQAAKFTSTPFTPKGMFVPEIYERCKKLGYDDEACVDIATDVRVYLMLSKNMSKN
jgi:hypothetical protein